MSPGRAGPAARRINREFAQFYPDAHCELDFTNPLELLVATILSAQTTDVRVNMVTPTLFAKYRTAEDYASADRTELETIIQSTGFYRAKTTSLIKLGQALCERFGGESAQPAQGLGHAAGCGRKTANVVLGNAFKGGSRWTPISAGWPAGSAGPVGRPGEGRAGGRFADSKVGVDDAVAPLIWHGRESAIPAGRRAAPARSRGIAPRTAWVDRSEDGEQARQADTSGGRGVTRRLALLGVVIVAVAGCANAGSGPVSAPLGGGDAPPIGRPSSAIAAAELAGVPAGGCGRCRRGRRRRPTAAITLDCLGAGPPVTLSGAGVGRPVVINVWASWCTPCAAEMPALCVQPMPTPAGRRARHRHPR
jgi:hypothetical protein